MFSRTSWKGTRWMLSLLFPLIAVPVRAQETSMLPPAPARCPLEKIPPAYQAACREVVERPTLHAKGPIEAFAGNATIYSWLLEHPDRAMLAWKRLGAKCTSIVEKSPGKFVWTDSIGSEVSWSVALKEPDLYVWYAEGKVRPNSLFPLVPVQAVVLMRYRERTEKDRQTVSHQAEVYFLLPGRTAAATARLLGPSAPKLAEQGLGQLELFFSGLVWYLEQHPKRTEALLAVAAPRLPAERAVSIRE